MGRNGEVPGPWERNCMSLILVALIGLIIGETLLNVFRLLCDRTALVVTSEGVQGWHAWLRRSFKWEEVSHVRQSGNTLWIHKHPKSRLVQGWNSHCRPGGRYHWSQLLIVDLNHIDKSPDAIFAQINRYWETS
jgi:hypothetical protein